MFNPITAPPYACVYGSHGTLRVDMASGIIVDRDRDGDGYDDIVMFDVTDLKREGGDTDILYVGFFYTDKTGKLGYTPALSPMCVHDRYGEAHYAGDNIAYLTDQRS